jgi:hypothetical protein
MATAKPITLRDYLAFMGDLILIRKPPTNRDIAYLKLNPKYMDSSQLICKESVIVEKECGYKALAEPIGIFTAISTPDDVKRAFTKLSHMLTQLYNKFPHLKQSIFTHATNINGIDYEVIYSEVKFEENSYEDMQLIFGTFKELQKEAERLLVILTYHDFISKGIIILNYSNPMTASNYVREVMSTSSV